MIINALTWIFVGSVGAYVLTLFWLNARQKRAVIRSFNTVPDEFAHKISLKQHQKAANYARAKLKLNHVEIIFSISLLLLWTLGGGLALLDDFWQTATQNPLLIGTGFILSLMLIGSAIELPLSWYRTFVLEQKFGFNQATTRVFVMDFFKELLLMLLIGLPLIYAVLYLMAAMGAAWWLYVWGVLTGFSLLMLWLYPTYIAPLFNQFKPLDDDNLRQKITDLLTRTGFKSDGVFVMDGSKRSAHGNAYFTGIGKHKRIVFFDTLLEGMDDAEVEAILAHELGHFHHHHVRKQMLTTFLMTLLGLGLLGFLLQQSWFFAGLGVPHASNHTALALFTLVLPVFTFFIAPIRNYLSRKFEFEADAFAAEHTRASTLIAALLKLYRDNAATLTPDKYYAAFHDSHPNAALRIAHLKGFDND